MEKSKYSEAAHKISKFILKWKILPDLLFKWFIALRLNLCQGLKDNWHYLQLLFDKQKFYVRQKQEKYIWIFKCQHTNLQLQYKNQTLTLLSLLAAINIYYSIYNRVRISLQHWIRLSAIQPAAPLKEVVHCD